MQKQKSSTYLKDTCILGNCHNTEQTTSRETKLCMYYWSQDAETKFKSVIILRGADVGFNLNTVRRNLASRFLAFTSIQKSRKKNYKRSSQKHK